MTKKDAERQKLLEEKEAEAAVLKQFVETFEKPASTGISFVKGSTYNAGNGTGKRRLKRGRVNGHNHSMPFASFSIKEQK